MTDELAIRDIADGCTLAVWVHPGAKRNAIAGLHAGALKVSITAPATDGRANDALIAFVAEWLGLPRARVSLIAGATNRSKTLRIAGKSAAEVQAALVELC
jgi:uncharacterized protein (TIGR00251 family)